MVVTELIYFIGTAVICRYYDRKSSKIRFLNITPVIISVVLAYSVSLFTPYQIDVLGFVIGVTLLYFSMASEFRFVDETRNPGCTTGDIWPICSTLRWQARTIYAVL